ncbi:hypothetical protein HZ326_24825 [Fusarium oxysporum f. sp. albedinis]|nr:hypothetical protein HZ326_24825 [Fusarium oxysporum f. sp. albedinis]
MNAVDACFPSSSPLLCLWHANKAVLRYCQPRSTRHAQGDNQGIEAWNEFYGHWHSIINSPNEQTFHERVSEFEKKYLSDYIEEVRYVKTNWLDQYKEKLVKAWVNQHPHFDNVVTSRVEGIHWLLKSHLKVSTLDLFEARRSIKHALINQLAELRSNQAKQKIRTPIELSSTLYSAVRGWVSREALRKVEQQRKLLMHEDSTPSSACIGSFSRSQGLPCAHKLESLLGRDQALQLEDFHPHWHLIRKDNRLPILEPCQRIDPITVSSSLPLPIVRRELSDFEVIENARPMRNPPLCSKCHILGHARNSKVSTTILGTKSIASPPEQPRPSATTTFDGLQWQPIITLETFEFEPELISQDLPFQLTIEAEQVDRDITTAEPRHPSPTPSICRPPVSSPLPSRDPAPDSTTHWRYDDPRAIHPRYVKSRDDWYTGTRFPERDVLVVSVYVEGRNEQALEAAMGQLHTAIAEFRNVSGRRTNVILVGDFNRHDTLWGGDEVTGKRQCEAGPIIELMGEHGLHSLLPRGTKTWEGPGGRTSTIDLVLASTELADEMTSCGIHPIEHGSDHRAIRTEFDTTPLERTPGDRLLFKNAPWLEIKERVRSKPEALPCGGTVQAQTDRLMSVMLDAINDLVPRAKPSPYAKRWWTTDLTRLRRMYTYWRNQARACRRRGREAAGLEQKAREAAKEYHDAIRRQKKAHWDSFLEDGANI